MLTFKGDDCRNLVKARVGASSHAALDAIAFLEFPDVAESTKQDVEFLKKHDLILKDTPVTGWIYEVETGRVVKVV